MGKKNLVKKLVAAGGLAGAIAMSQGCATSSGMNYDSRNTNLSGFDHRNNVSNSFNRSRSFDNSNNSYIGFGVNIPLGGDKSTSQTSYVTTLATASQGNVAGVEFIVSGNKDYQVDSFALNNQSSTPKTNFNVNLVSGIKGASMYTEKQVLGQNVITGNLYSNNPNTSAMINYNAATGETTVDPSKAVLVGIGALGVVAALSGGGGGGSKDTKPQETEEVVEEPVVDEPVVPAPTPEPTPGDGGGDGGSIN